MNNDNKTKLVKVTGLYVEKDKNGNNYLTFKIDEVRYLIFTNSYKKEDKHPDYVLYKSVKETL